MKKKFSTILLIFILLAGMSLLLYPSVSNWWNERVQSQAISAYVEAMEDYSEADFAEMRSAAEAYNKTLVYNESRYHMSDEDMQRYLKLLDPAGSGIMSYIEIPAINTTLPIYHGTSSAVLQAGVGHLEGTSLPIGGESTHCVLSGHRGLPSAKLFTNLNKLAEGDVFYIHTLNEQLTYEVDQILILEPDDISALSIIKGEDYCTLITCTPYGVNSHRLLVRGTRIATPEGAAQLNIMGEAFEIDSLLLAPIIATPFLLVLLIILLIKPRNKHR